MPLFPYTVIAHRKGEKAIRFGVMAPNPSDAIICAQELYPDHFISSATIHPDWHDDDDQPA